MTMRVRWAACWFAWPLWNCRIGIVELTAAAVRPLRLELVRQQVDLLDAICAMLGRSLASLASARRTSACRSAGTWVGSGADL